MPMLEAVDQLFGLRSWGLMLYGALPACLSLLGVLEIKLGTIDRPIPILLISLLPLLVTYLLVRAREKEWYLTGNYLAARSCITTLMIVFCATAISGASGIIRHKYDFQSTNLTDQAHLTAIAESFLFGIASLVISSTLFATVLTKGTDLPGLPSSDFLGSIKKARQQLIPIRAYLKRSTCEPSEGIKPFQKLLTDADNLINELNLALSQPGHRLAKRSLRPVQSDLKLFARSLAVIIGAGADENLILSRWKTFFVQIEHLSDDLKPHRRNYQAEHDALQRLKALKLGG